jgi:AcrR family transcriptional regulator
MSDPVQAPRDVHDFAHGRVPRAVREQQILSLAEELFAQRGYEGTSMDELAQRAGVSKPMIYSFVENKEALLQRCFERAGEELHARMVAAAAEPHDDLAGEIRATGRAFYDFVDEHSSAWAMLFSLDTGGRTEASMGVIRRRQSEFTAERITMRAAARGSALDPVHANAAAALLNSGYEALAHWRRDHPETPTDQLVDWLVAFTVPGLEALLDDRAATLR